MASRKVAHGRERAAHDVPRAPPPPVSVVGPSKQACLFSDGEAYPFSSDLSKRV